MRQLSAAKQPGAIPTTDLDLHGTADETLPGSVTWQERLRKALPSKPDPDCDGDLCDTEWRGKGSVTGAALLIAGSAMGGGMLSVPNATIPAGFGPSLASMCGVWLFLVMQSLLLAEVNIAVAGWLKRRSTSMLVLSRITLGRAVGAVVAAAYLLFSTATLVSQIIKGGTILSDVIPGVPYAAGAVAVAATGGGIIYANTSSGVDRTNSALTAALILSFAVLLMIGASSAHWPQLTRANWASLPGTTPTMLQALNFGNLVPVVCTYLNGDPERIRRAVIVGSIIPLVMIGAWTAMSCALVPPAAGAVDPTDLLIQGGSGSVVSAVVTAFAGFAVFTTIIGVLMSLHEFWEEALRGRAADVGTRAPCPWWEKPEVQRLATRALALGPAVLVAVFAPQRAFHDVLRFSGAYLVTFLFGAVPPLMALVTRGQFSNRKRRRGPTSEPILPYGHYAIAGLLICTVRVPRTANSPLWSPRESSLSPK